MRRFPSSWDNTLAALGFRRNVKRIKRDWRRRKGAWLESLERREMLAGDTPTPIRPEYVLVDQTDDAGLSPFVVSTEYAADGAATAVVSLDESLGQPDRGVHELNLELRLGELVLESQQLAINLAQDEFSDAFYRDRLQLVHGLVRSATAEELQAWRDELGADGVFASVGGSLEVSASEDALLESAQRLAAMAAYHREVGPLVSEVEERRDFYAGVLRVAGAVASIEEPQRAETVRNELGRVALMIGKQLGYDLPSNKALTAEATQARDAMLAIVSPYYTVLGPYGLNTELVHSEEGAVAASAVAVVEQGVFELDDRLRVELGTHNAFVGATITSSGQAASTAPLSVAIEGAQAFDATWVSAISDKIIDTPTITAATNSAGEVTHAALVGFDLTSEQGNVPRSATLTLTATGSGGVEHELRRATSSWFETPDEDIWTGSAIDYHPAAIPATSSNAGVFTYDVTEVVQRSLLLGDANADGLVDHDYEGTLHRRELAADVNAAYLAIRDWDRYRDQYGGLEIVPGDLLYRVDANWDGVASAVDGRMILDRLGVAGGDFDLDGDVDVTDLAAYQANYGKVAQAFADGDADFNGFVNAYDYDIWDSFDASALSYKKATPHFEVTLPSTGQIDINATSSAPKLDLTYEADVEITDVHAYGVDGVTGNATGEVVVEYRALHEDMASDATAQLVRVPADGGPMEDLGAPVALSALPLAGAAASYAFAPSALSGLNAGDRVAVTISSVADGYSHTRLLSRGVVYDGAHTAHLFGEGLRDTASLGDGDVTLSNPADGALTLHAVSHFEEVHVSLGGGDDTIWLRSDFTESTTIDGGAGNDQIDVQFDLGGGAAIDIRDTQGVNDALFWVNGSLSLVNAGEQLDPRKRGAQTFTLDYVNDEPEEEPQWGPSGHAGDFQITLANAFSLRRLQGVADPLLAPGVLLVDTLLDVDNDDFSRGDLSLREALRLADSLPGEQAIEFDPGLFGSSRATLQLTNGSAGLNDYIPHSHWGANAPEADAPQPLTLRSDVQINGPGADLLEINGGGETQVIVLEEHAGLEVAIRNVAIADGYYGGATRSPNVSSFGNDLVLERVEVHGGDAPATHSAGGAVYFRDGDLTVRDSYFHDNRAHLGGGVYFHSYAVSNRLEISGTTIAHNTAASIGGGVYAVGTNAELEIAGSTISHNTGDLGGGVYTTATSSQTTITDTTVHGNHTANAGSGLRNNAGPSHLFTLHNTIVAGNTASSGSWSRDRYGVMDASSSNNLIQHSGSAGPLNTPDNLIGDDPLLGPLADNGGHAPTHALGVDSPAINEGDATLGAASDHDQRGAGYGRVRGAAQDIGAYESAFEQAAVGGVGVIAIHGSELDDEILVTPGFVYLGGLSGTAIPFELNGLPLHVHGGKGDDTITLMPGVENVTLFGDSGDDLLFGASGSETLRGGDGNDELYGRGGNDFLYGDDGEDVLYGGDGADELYGGERADRLLAGGGDDTLHGNAGDDHLDGGIGADSLYGGANDDTLLVSDETAATTDLYFGDLDHAGDSSPEVGNDTYLLPATANATWVLADGGEDTIDLSRWELAAQLDLAQTAAMQELAIGATGFELYLLGSSVVRVIGTEHNDTLIGTANAETLDGRGGNDTLIGGGGNDHLLGGFGDDQLLGWDATPAGEEILIYDGGYDDDTYWITDAITVDTTVRLRDAEGVDQIKAGALNASGTIDVSEWDAAHGVTIDLSDSETQLVYDNGASTLTLDLPGEDVIEHVTGTDQADTLSGNTLVNTLDGLLGANRFVYEEGVDTQLGQLASETPELTIAAPRVWNGTASLVLEIDQAAPSPGVIQSVEALGPLGGSVALSGTGATRSVTLSGSHSDGVYPLTLRVTAADGRVGIVMVEVTIGSATPATPTITHPGDAVRDTTDPRTYTYAFTVTGTNEVRLAGDLPASLQAAYDAAPSSVLYRPDAAGAPDDWVLEWSTVKEDVGEHRFRLEATDANPTPRRYSLPVTLAVPEYDEPARVKRVTTNGPFAVDFAYAPTATAAVDLRSDPSFSVTLVNDDGFDNVRIVVDWTYDENDGFQADQTLYGRGEEIEGAEWNKLVAPNSHTYFADAVAANSDTRVAFRVEEYRPDDTNAGTDGYVAIEADQPDPNNASATLLSEVFSSDSSGAQLDYHPDATESLAFASWGLLGGVSHDPVKGYASTDVTIVGSLTNENSANQAVAAVEGLRVHFYKVGASEEWIGTATTDENGAFEFVARGAFDLDDFTQDQTATIRAKVQDPAAVLPPADSTGTGWVTTAGIDLDADIATNEELFTLEVPEAPAFDLVDGVYLKYDDTPRLEGLGFVRQPQITGKLTSTNVPVEGLTVLFDLGASESIAVADSSGDFTFLPPITLDQYYSINADIVTWDDFRRQPLVTTARSLTIDPTDSAYQPGAYEAPAINNYASDGSAYVPTFSGVVTPASVDSTSRVLVEFSDDSAFGTILAEVLTELDGSFAYRFTDLTPGSHTIYARTVGWNHWADPGNEWVTGNPSYATVAISATPPTPTLASLTLANDTGTVGDDQSADPTLEGHVVYAGEMLDVQVEFDLNGDDRADQTVLPDENGYFRFAPSGLTPGDGLTVTAWAVAPDYGSEIAFDLDPAFQAILDDGPTHGDGQSVGWSAEQLNGESAQAWFDELFQSDAKFGGDWYDADFAPDWTQEQRSDGITRTITFLDPSSLTYSVANVASSGGTTFGGQVTSEGEVGDLLVEVYLNRGDSLAPVWELDSQTRTDDAGGFTYTPHTLSKPGDDLKLVLHQPVYDDPFSTIEHVRIVADPFNGVDAAHDATLDAIALLADQDAGLVDHATAAPLLRDRIANAADPDFNPAGWIVEFDLNDDGRPDAAVFTDADGYYEHDFTDRLYLNGIDKLQVRLLKESWNATEKRAYQAHSQWVTVFDDPDNDPTEDAWPQEANPAPVIQRFELLNDTGVASTALNERVLDRVTTDPTVVGRVIEAAPYSTVEFSHRGDGAVDGYATTDASGRFEYRPEGLTTGFWDLRARVVEANGQTTQSSGWQPITATGDPQTAGSAQTVGAAIGFELVDPTAATVDQFSLLSAVDSTVDSDDVRLFVKVSDVDSVENVFVDIYEGQALIATTALEPDGTAEVVPIGVTLGEPVTLTAVARELNPYTGQPVVGSVTQQLVDLNFAATGNAGPSIQQLFSGGIDLIDPTLYGDLTPQPDGNAPAGLSVPELTPVEAVFEVTYVTKVGENQYDRETIYDSVAYVPGDEAHGLYQYAYTPDLSRWPDGVPTTDSIEIRVRGVAIKGGALVMGDWYPAHGGPAFTLSGASLGAYSRPRAELTLESRYDDGAAAPLDELSSGQETLSPVFTATAATTLESLGDAVRVESRYVEFSTAGTPAGEVEFTAPIDEDGVVDLSDYGLDYGVLTLEVRLVEEALADEDRTNGDPAAEPHYLDAFESGETRRIAGAWETVTFKLIDSRPGIEAGSLALVDGHTPQGASVPEAIDPVVEGKIESALYETDDLGGLTVEYDLNGDGLADGSTLTYTDGTFEFRPNVLINGEHTIQVRVVDPYGGEETLEGAWESFTFKRVAVLAPGFASGHEPALETDPAFYTFDAVNGGVSTAPIIAGQVAVGDALSLGLDDLTVEFDFNGDGNADDSTLVDVTDPTNATFSYDASGLAYGEAAVRVRTAAWNGAERVHGDWTSPIEFFHKSDDAPAVALDALPVDFDTTGVVSGRATIGGFGAGATIEIVTIRGEAGSEIEYTSYARADENGLFSVVPPRLRNDVPGTQQGTHTIRVRGVATVGGQIVPGLWNEAASLPPLDLPTPATPVWETGSFQAAYPNTLVGGVYGDPTLRGAFNDHYEGSVVEIDYDNDDTVDATAILDGEGAFLHTPDGLTPNQTYTIRARWSRWNPETGQQAHGVWVNLAEGDLTFDPMVGGAPQVTDLQLLQIDPDAAVVATELTPFVGQVTGDGHVGGLTVWFDHNGDGVAEGKTYTRADGHFTYHARGVTTGQTLDAWVDPPEYSQVAPAAPFSLPFALSAAPSIASVVYRVDPLERITGQVGWDGERATEVEYRFSADAATTARSGVTAADLSDPALTYERAHVTKEGRFHFAVPAGATTLVVRAVAGDSVGRWKQLRLAARPSEHALPVTRVEPLYPDAGNAEYSADPTLWGRVGDPGQGAYAVVEVLRDELGNGEYVPIGRVTADARGEFLFTVPDDYGTPNGSTSISHDLRFRTIVWDPVAESEAPGDAADISFTWVASAPAITLAWAEVNSGEIDNPTVIGSVARAGRKAGIRVEFNHGSGEDVHGFAYTDANGEFRYTPIGLAQAVDTTLTITARAIVWDDDPQAEDPDFADHASEASVAQVSATLKSAAPDGVSPIEFTDQTNDELALAALKDAVFASLDDLGFAGDEGTLDAGFGDIALLHRGGGEGDFDTPAFIPETTGGYAVPVSSASDSDYRLITPGGVLTGGYTIVVDTANNASGDLESASEVSFELTIDSYVTHADQETPDDPGLYDRTSTQLELSGVYKFTFSTDSDAVYNAGSLESLDHFITEEVDYDYTIFDAAAPDDPVNGATRPIDARSVATGGSEYTLRLGDAAGADPARFDNSAATSYSGPISHEQTNRLDGYGDAAGSVTTHSDGGVTVTRTYVETVTKTGQFNGADSPGGTIKVAIAETILTTTDTVTSLNEGNEQSSESLVSTEFVTRNYSGSATYDSNSVSGSATLTETTTYEAEVAGAGVASTGAAGSTHQTDRWEYEGAASASSTFTLAGSFYESLNAASPTRSSDYAGSHASSSSLTWEGQYVSSGATVDATGQQTASHDVGGGERLDRSGSVSGQFAGHSHNATTHLQGEYASRGAGAVKEWSEGRLTETPDGSSNRTDFRSLTFGNANSSTDVTYTSDSSPASGDVLRENVTYDVTASGDSFYAAQSRGHEELGPGQGNLGFFSRITTEGSIDLTADGTSRQGSGSFDDNPFTPSEYGTAQLETASKVGTMSASWTRDSAGTTFTKASDKLEQFTLHDDQQTDVAFKHTVTTSSRELNAAFVGDLPEEHEPGAFPAEPTEEDFEGTFVGARLGADLRTTTQGAYSTGGPDGPTEDISTNVKDNRGGVTKSIRGFGESGKNTNQSASDHEDRNRGGHSIGAGGLSGGAHANNSGDGESSNKNTSKSRAGDGPSRSSSSGSSRNAANSSHTGGHVNGAPTAGSDNRSGDGASSARSASSSTARDGDNVSSGSSSSNSGGSGGSFANAQGTPGDADATYGQSGKGGASSSSSSGQFGPGGGASSTSESSSNSASGSGGAASIHGLEVRPGGSNWSNSSGGETTTTWASYGAFANGYSVANGSTTTGGSQSASGGAGPDGSQADLRTSSNGSSDASSHDLRVHALPTSVGVHTVTTNHTAQGGSSSSTTLKNGRVTDTSSSSGNGGTNRRVETGETKTPTYRSSSEHTFTTTSSSNNGETTGTDKHEWDHSSQSTGDGVVRSAADHYHHSSPSPFYLGSSTLTTESSGSASETVSRGGQRDSATVNSEGTYRSTFDGWGSLGVTELTIHRFDVRENSSNYTSSHSNGPNGAQGGTFSQSVTGSDRGGTTLTESSTASSINGPVHFTEDYSFLSWSQSTSGESGSYEDTPAAASKAPTPGRRGAQETARRRSSAAGASLSTTGVKSNRRAPPAAPTPPRPANRLRATASSAKSGPTKRQTTRSTPRTTGRTAARPRSPTQVPPPPAEPAEAAANRATTTRRRPRAAGLRSRRCICLFLTWQRTSARMEKNGYRSSMKA